MRLDDRLFGNSWVAIGASEIQKHHNNAAVPWLSGGKRSRLLIACRQVDAIKHDRVGRVRRRVGGDQVGSSSD